MVSRGKKSIAEILREQRELRGLTQAELADRAELTAAAISHFETGLRVPSPRNLLKLAEALEVTMDFLIGRETISKPTGRSIDMIFRSAESLSSDSLEALRDFAEMLAKRERKKRQSDDDKTP